MLLADRFAQLGEENAFAVLARANALKAQGRDMINLGIGQPDFRTPDIIVESAIKALRDGAHGYTDSLGIPPLREKVVEYLSKRGVSAQPDRVMIVPGGKVTMFFACMLLGQPGQKILYPDPGFPIYRSAAAVTGAEVVGYRLREDDDFAPDMEQLETLVDAQTSLLIVNSPGNPTGGIMRQHHIEQIAELMRRHPQLIVMSDEIYGEMLYDGEKHFSLASINDIADRVILLDGWSKTFAMTGWRMGFGLWPSALIDAARKLSVNCHSCVAASYQHAAITALDEAWDQVEHMVATFDRRRKFAADLLNDLPGVTCRVPKGAFYAFPNITQTGRESRELAKELLENHSLALLSGTDFGAQGEGFLRVSVAASDEDIQKGVDRIRTCLAQH